MKSFISECENHSETHLHSTSYALTNSWLTLLRPAASTARATLFELSRQSSMYTLPEDAKCASDACTPMRQLSEISSPSSKACAHACMAASAQVRGCHLRGRIYHPTLITHPRTIETQSLAQSYSVA